MPRVAVIIRLTGAASLLAPEALERNLADWSDVWQFLHTLQDGRKTPL